MIPEPSLTFRRDDGAFLLEASQWLPRPLAEVFPFFADALNLEALTPPLLRFHVATPSPIEIRQGTLIDYRLKLRGIPLRWRSEIRVWEPPRRFVDFQVRGPYLLWHHEHLFDEVDGGTLVRDRVHYRVLGGALVERFLVRPDLRRIFAFRQEYLARLFSTPNPTQEGGDISSSQPDRASPSLPDVNP